MSLDYIQYFSCANFISITEYGCIGPKQNKTVGNFTFRIKSCNVVSCYALASNKIKKCSMISRITNENWTMRALCIKSWIVNKKKKSLSCNSHVFIGGLLYKCLFLTVFYYWSTYVLGWLNWT